ncbi:MAG: TrbG/VirB9 family P-type conjugative transfer protein [Alphaproteobacteria bacterium]|nr:TrbG/VirB9 family P-type conjugative transfer protein [Alphaproteobacteria bacterium]
MTPKFLRFLVLVHIIIVLLAFAIAPYAHAQTAMHPNGGIPRPPVPPSTIDQAKSQAEGAFSSMRRSVVGGQIQEAWDEAPDDAGVVRFQFCGTCSYKMRLRQHMVTVLELPSGETIERADVGDKDEFDVQQRSANRLSIKPAGYGVDSNLMIFGKSGTVYPVYLRTESYNSVNVPDLFVRIDGSVTTREIAVDGLGGFDARKDGHLPDAPAGDAGKAEIPPLDIDPKTQAVAGLEADKQGRKPGDFVKSYPFNPNELYGWGEFELWGGGPHIDAMRKSVETVFRDDHMVYVRLKPGYELPVGYVVVDDLDELVNTRIDGNTFIIEVEKDRNLFTLKNGETYLCIKYTGSA